MLDWSTNLHIRTLLNDSLINGDNYQLIMPYISACSSHRAKMASKDSIQDIWTAYDNLIVFCHF